MSTSFAAAEQRINIMSKSQFTGRIAKVFASFAPQRTYGSPRHLNDYMLKDIGITADELGTTRRLR
jgi:hypothetical protein